MTPKHSTTPALGSTSSRTDRAVDATRSGIGDERSEVDTQFFTHLITVLSVASGMVGVCLTAIGLIGIMKNLGMVDTIVDDLLAIGAMLFMVTAVLSFLGMRTNITKTWHHFARTLDLLFCVGLVVMVLATALLTWVVM